MDVTVLITIGVLAAGLGIVLGRYVWPAVRASDRDALTAAQTEVGGSYLARNQAHCQQTFVSGASRVISWLESRSTDRHQSA
jgi:hypothetical protein